MYIQQVPHFPLQQQLQQALLQLRSYSVTWISVRFMPSQINTKSCPKRISFAPLCHGRDTSTEIHLYRVASEKAGFRGARGRFRKFIFSRPRKIHENLFRHWRHWRLSFIADYNSVICTKAHVHVFHYFVFSFLYFLYMCNERSILDMVEYIYVFQLSGNALFFILYANILIGLIYSRLHVIVKYIGQKRKLFLRM